VIEKIAEFLKEKKVCILGYGVEGQSSHVFFQTYLPNADVTIRDIKKDGAGYLDNLNQFDIILKTPGISFKDMDIDSFKSKISSQVELFLTFADCEVIGVTGTKGKSTTTSLIYAVLQENGVHSLLLGNIGAPIFSHLEEITSDTVVVAELSSHQLEFVRHSPRISVITNIFPEHLDHYESFEHYAAAKEKIWNFQGSDGIFFDGRKIEDWELDAVDERVPNRKLLGRHNLVNIKLTLEVAGVLGLDVVKSLKAIENFEGLPHRMEHFASINGIDFYDDSIATIPQATIGCVEALGDVTTLIVGGVDRGVGQEPLIELLARGVVKNVICMPDTGRYIVEKLPDAHFVQTLDEGVKVAKEVTKGGKCVLSPAAASYGFFKNFQDRGNTFKALVQEIFGLD
jgi:UDP-N-acetylmuramoylalanine--D-glutamate ligase